MYRFNHDSSIIASLYGRDQIILWNCFNNCVIEELKNDGRAIVFFDFVGDNFVFVSEDGQMKTFNLSNGKSSSFPTNASIIDGCKLNEKVLLLTSDSNLLVCDVIKMTLTGRFKESDIGSQEHNGFFGITSKGNGNEIILSGKNRALRILSIDLENCLVYLKFKLQDVVDKYSWKCAGFSYHTSFDASFTFAATATKGKHLIYIWENSTSNLVQKIEGPKEEISQVLWSPIKPQLYSVGALSGKIYVLGPQFPQKWAALVPNIEALETNIEYIEREDEFDLSPEDEITKNRQHVESIELDLDSFTTPTISNSKCSTILFPL